MLSVNVFICFFVCVLVSLVYTQSYDQFFDVQTRFGFVGNASFSLPNTTSGGVKWNLQKVIDYPLQNQVFFLAYQNFDIMIEQSNQNRNNYIFGWFNVSRPAQAIQYSLNTLLNCSQREYDTFWTTSSVTIEEPSAANNQTAYLYLVVGMYNRICTVQNINFGTTQLEFATGNNNNNAVKLIKLRLSDFRYVWHTDFPESNNGYSFESIEVVSDDLVVLSAAWNVYYSQIVGVSTKTGKIQFTRGITVGSGSDKRPLKLLYLFGKSFAIASSNFLFDITVKDEENGQVLASVTQAGSSYAAYFVEFSMDGQVVIANVFGRTSGTIDISLEHFMVDPVQQIYLLACLFYGSSSFVCYGSCTFQQFVPSGNRFLLKQRGFQGSKFTYIPITFDAKAADYDAYQQSFVRISFANSFSKTYINPDDYSTTNRFNHQIVPSTDNPNQIIVKQLARGSSLIMGIEHSKLIIDGNNYQLNNISRIYFMLKDTSLRANSTNLFTISIPYAGQHNCFLQWATFDFLPFKFEIEFNGTKYNTVEPELMLQNLPSSLSSVNQSFALFRPYFSKYISAAPIRVPIYTAPEHPSNIVFTYKSKNQFAVSFKSTLAKYSIRVNSTLLAIDFTSGTIIQVGSDLVKGERISVEINAENIKYSIAVSTVNYIFNVPPTLQNIATLKPRMDENIIRVENSPDFRASYFYTWNFVSNDKRIQKRFETNDDQLKLMQYSASELIYIPYIYNISVFATRYIDSTTVWITDALQLSNYLLTFDSLPLFGKIEGDNVYQALNVHQQIQLGLNNKLLYPNITSYVLNVTNLDTNRVVHLINSSNPFNYNLTVTPVTTYSFFGKVTFANGFSIPIYESTHTTPPPPPKVHSIQYNRNELNLTYSLSEMYDLSQYSYNPIMLITESLDKDGEPVIDSLGSNDISLGNNVRLHTSTRMAVMPKCSKAVLIVGIMKDNQGGDGACISLIQEINVAPETPKFKIISYQKNSMLLQINSTCQMANFKVILTSTSEVITRIPTMMDQTSITSSLEVSGNVANITNLKSNTKYQVQVMAYISDSSFDGSELSASIPIQTLIADSPSKILSFYTTNTNTTSVPLYWTVPLDDGGAPVVFYQIEIVQSGSFDSVVVNTSDASTSFTITLHAFTDYLLRVRAVNADDRLGEFSSGLPIRTGYDEKLLGLIGLTGLLFIPGALLCCIIGIIILVLICYAIRKAKRKQKSHEIIWDGQLLTIDQELLEQIGKQYILDFKKLNYSSNEVLGSGAQGTVYKGSYFNIPVAVKLFAMSNFGMEADLTDFFTESKFLAEHSNHPNIVRFIGIAHNPESNQIALVTELCSGGSLARFIEKNENVDWNLKLQILCQVASGMAYLHSSNIIHRDLKCENVLLDANRNPRIIDFGLSKQIQDMNKTMNMTMNIGTAAYIAPELLVSSNTSQSRQGLSNVSGQKSASNEPLAGTVDGQSITTTSSSSKKTNYDMKVDIYAFAIMMYAVYFGVKNPYGEMLDFQILAELSRDKEFRPFLEESMITNENKWFIELMKQCWNSDPAERPTFEEIYATLEKHKQ